MKNIKSQPVLVDKLIVLRTWGKGRHCLEQMNEQFLSLLGGAMYIYLIHFYLSSSKVAPFLAKNHEQNVKGYFGVATYLVVWEPVKI